MNRAPVKQRSRRAGLNTAQTPETVFTQGGKLQQPIARAIADSADSAGDVRLLEAGCGLKWDISVPGVRLRITGVDLDEVALRLRKEQVGDLEEAIVGDLRTVALPDGAYDVVYCSYVLEHVAGAEGVLDKFVASLRRGGHLVIRVPDGDSVYGWAAKHAPFKVQVAYKRYIEGYKDAGKPGHAPYPVAYDPVISLRGMRRYAASRNLTTVFEGATNTYMRGTFGAAAPFVQRVLDLVSALSRGRLVSTHNNLVLIYQTPQ